MLTFFKKHYLLFLFLVVLISYGQILFMLPWQEDNVIFFKVAHIFEQAGYLGKGILGAGPYRHTITPYYFIYKLFGYNIPLYYLLMLVSYYTATVSIYFLAKNIISKSAARIASFLFACGYVASEGFLRVYTSTNISSGIAAVSFLFLAYWKYYKTNKAKWYLITVFLYWFTVQVTYVRAHYVILPLLAFDFIFLTFPHFSKIRNFILRAIPFIYIFYEYYIVQGDSRSEGISEVGKALLQGEFRYTSSFLGSLGNLIVPDFIQQNPILIGIASLIIGLYIFKKLTGEKRKIFAVFAILILANLASYAVYTPLVVYATKYRYLAHSFFAFCVILSLFSESNKRIFKYFLVLWGVMFLLIGFQQQNTILIERTQKIRSFYTTLKQEMPKLEKDSVVYFDIQDDPVARQMYAVSFSVAEMPETTAIAWRYGIDRYDFKMFTDFEELIKEIEINKVAINKVHTFWISGSGLVNTTYKFRTLAQKNMTIYEKDNISIKSTTELAVQTNGHKLNQSDLVIDLPQPIDSVYPLNIKFQIKAAPLNTSNLSFPLYKTESVSQIYKNNDLVNKAFNYKQEKEFFLKNIEYSASSEWKERVLENINDGDPDTVWQVDRILWEKERGYVSMDLKKEYHLGAIAWINGYSNNTPKDYVVETSIDGINWEEIAKVTGNEKINEPSVQKIKFAPITTRYVRLFIQNSIGDDSPSISEIWPIGENFSDLDLNESESFLKLPFEYITNNDVFLNTMKGVNYIGRAKIYWLGNQSSKWLTSYNTFVNISYDNKSREYDITIPPEGTNISKIKISDIQLPGEIIVQSLKIETKPLIQPLAN